MLLSGGGEPEAQAYIVQQSGLEWTIVRSSCFYQNFSEGAFAEMVLDGRITLPAGNAPEPFVDVDDIADVAGFVFAFSVGVMPGIHELDDGDFIPSFQRIDGVIQNGDPIFGLVFVGSIVALLAAVVLGAPSLAGLERTLLLAAGAIYITGVVLPTGVVNAPLNNRLQELEVDAMDASQRRSARQAFEPRWNRWNRIRTGLACTSAALMSTLLIIL